MSLQTFSASSYNEGNHTLTVNETETDHEPFSYGPNGDVDDVLVAVSNVGCEAVCCFTSMFCRASWY